jgi:hypothetical protein
MRRIDLTGLKFDRLTAICIDRSFHSYIKWECVCACGKKLSVSGSHLRSGHTRSCGCISESKSLKGRVGERIGKLILLEETTYNRAYFATPRLAYKCQCDCGKEKIIDAHSLLSGLYVSCGCYRLEMCPPPRQQVRLPPGEACFRALLKSYKRQSPSRSLAWKITDDEFAALTKGCCFYCSSEPKAVWRLTKCRSTYTYNGVDRLDNSLGYISGNVVSCCGRCNRMKSNVHILLFLQHINKIYEVMSSTDRFDYLVQKR